MVIRHPVHVHIKDFQSIEDLEFTISGFTTVTGSTNAGKSAIMRAISGLFKNSPVVGLVRKGSKFCQVKIRSKDWGFLWEKGQKGINRYYLINEAGNIINDESGKPRIFDKIGHGPIEQLAGAGFGSVEIGDEISHPWYADQFNPIFLLNKSGPAVTDFFSDVAHLKVLQDAIILCARRRKKSLEESKLKNEEILRLKEREKKFENLDSVAKLVFELQEQIDSINTYERKINKGTKFLSDITKIQNNFVILNQTVKLPQDHVAGHVHKIKKMTEHWTGLEESAKQIKKVRDITSVMISESPTQEFDRYKKIIKFAGVSKLQKSLDTLSKISECKIPNVGIEIKKFGFAQKINLEISKLQIDKIRFENRITTLEKEIAETQKEIDSIPSCSTCGRPTFSEHSHARRVSA